MAIVKKDNELVLVADKKSEFSVVFSDKLEYRTDSETGKVDFEVQVAKDICDWIISNTGAKLSVRSDWMNEPNSYEILVGGTNREETAAFKSSLALNEYGFKAIGNKIVVAGHNYASTSLAGHMLRDYIKKELATNGKVTLADGYEEKKANDEWFVDFPEYEGGEYVASNDGDLGTLLVYYENTNADEFEAYCKKLEANGFKLWQRYDIEDNLHATYTSENGLVHTYFTGNERTTRIVTSKEGNYALPRAKEQESYEKITDTTITQLACDYTRHDFGMGYVIILEDGSFLIYDGGDNGAEKDYMDVLYNKLKELNKRPDGKIVIAGWFVTHIHVDHYGALYAFLEKYGSEITLEQLYTNTMAYCSSYNTVSPDRRLQTNFDYLKSKVDGGFDFVETHTGMKFYVRNALIEIIHTCDDVFPQQIHYFNDTSIVWKMTVGGQASMWTGDIADFGCRAMCDKYDDFLKCDIVQVSHHGFIGATVEFYKKVGADIAFWPIAEHCHQDMIQPKYGYYSENYYVDSTCSTVIVAQEHKTVALPYRSGDPFIE